MESTPYFKHRYTLQYQFVDAGGVTKYSIATVTIAGNGNGQDGGDGGDGTTDGGSNGGNGEEGSSDGGALILFGAVIAIIVVIGIVVVVAIIRR